MGRTGAVAGPALLFGRGKQVWEASQASSKRHPSVIAKSPFFRYQWGFVTLVTLVTLETKKSSRIQNHHLDPHTSSPLPIQKSLRIQASQASLLLHYSGEGRSDFVLRDIGSLLHNASLIRDIVDLIGASYLTDINAWVTESPGNGQAMVLIIVDVAF